MSKYGMTDSGKRQSFGKGKHAKCINTSSEHYMRLVWPIECRRCLGFEPEAPSEENAPAKEVTPAPPGFMRRAFSYAKAMAEWNAAGRPERSDKEVERIFQHLCKPCKWFDPERQICRGCGCRVADNGYAVLNKIKMATEHCPRNFW